MNRLDFVGRLIVKRWWFVVGIAALTTLVLILFLGKNQDVWFDESYSVLLARQPIGTLLSLTSVDAHPPLFYLILKVWGSLFGWGELALRSLSAVFASLAVVAMAYLVRRLFSVKIALVTVPFLILAPFWLRYGYEIRMYALAGLLGILGSIVVLNAIKPHADRRWWIVYALIVVLSMYTLYVTALIWLSNLAWLLIRDHRHFWRQPWLKAYALAVILFLPYLPTMLFQSTHSALPGVGNVLNLTNIGNLVSMIIAYTPEWNVNSWVAAGILIDACIGLFLFQRIYRLSGPKERDGLKFILSFVILPFAVYWIVSLPLSQAFFIPRYLAHVSLFYYALIGIVAGLGWRHGFRKTVVVYVVIAIALLVIGINQLATVGNYNYERNEWQQTDTIRKTIDCAKSVVIADDAYTYINDSYYFSDCNLRVYSTHALPYLGGYAWLANHGDRLASPSGISAPSIVHIYMNNSTPVFKPDSRYRFVSSVRDTQQTADTYELVSK